MTRMCSNDYYYYLHFFSHTCVQRPILRNPSIVCSVTALHSFFGIFEIIFFVFVCPVEQLKHFNRCIIWQNGHQTRAKKCFRSHLKCERLELAREMEKKRHCRKHDFIVCIIVAYISTIRHWCQCNAYPMLRMIITSEPSWIFWIDFISTRFFAQSLFFVSSSDILRAQVHQINSHLFFSYINLALSICSLQHCVHLNHLRFDQLLLIYSKTDRNLWSGPHHFHEMDIFHFFRHQQFTCQIFFSTLHKNETKKKWHSGFQHSTVPLLLLSKMAAVGKMNFEWTSKMNAKQLPSNQLSTWNFLTLTSPILFSWSLLVCHFKIDFHI